MIPRANGGTKAASPDARTGRGGVTVVEALVAFLLLLLLMSGALAVVASQRSAATRILARAEALAAERLVRALLLEETRAGRPGVDWSVEGPGVLSLRAYRSWGTVCPVPGSGGDLLVRVNGIRAADPRKDSAAVLTTEGGWRVVDLVLREASTERCPPAPERPLERWRVEPPVTGAVLVRAFERGSYHLEDAALRYRPGAGGRQPLTPEVLDAAATGFDAVPGGALLRVRGRAGGGVWTRRLGPVPRR